MDGSSYTWLLELNRSRTSGCGYNRTSIAVPHAIFDEAIERDGRLTWRMDDDDSCTYYACDNANDTCVQDFDLYYAHE